MQDIKVRVKLLFEIQSIPVAFIKKLHIYDYMKFK